MAAPPRDRDEQRESIDAVLQVTPVFRKLAANDRLTVAKVAAIRRYDKGELIFEQGAPSDDFYTIASGRVKIFKRFASGKELIIEVFGRGETPRHPRNGASGTSQDSFLSCDRVRATPFARSTS